MHCSLDDNPEHGDHSNRSNGFRDTRQHHQCGDGDLDGRVGVKVSGKEKDGTSPYKEKDRVGIKEKDKVGVNHTNSRGGR